MGFLVTLRHGDPFETDITAAPVSLVTLSQFGHCLQRKGDVTKGTQGAVEARELSIRSAWNSVISVPITNISLRIDTLKPLRLK